MGLGDILSKEVDVRTTFYNSLRRLLTGVKQLG
jgi:hypothetical protein